MVNINSNWNARNAQNVGNAASKNTSKARSTEGFTSEMGKMIDSQNKKMQDIAKQLANKDTGINDGVSTGAKKIASSTQGSRSGRGAISRPVYG